MNYENYEDIHLFSLQVSCAVYIARLSVVVKLPFVPDKFLTGNNKAQ